MRQVLRAFAMVAAGFTVIAVTAQSAAAASAVELYTLNCWGCHQPHAEGIPGTVPRLAHSMGYFLALPEGRAYLVQVPGVANSPLNDEQIVEVLNWLLVTFSKDELPKDFKPYTLEEVRKLRPHPLLNVQESRAALAKRLAAKGCTVAPGL
jgi:mono/diheme cytochrome c family protein